MNALRVLVAFLVVCGSLPAADWKPVSGKLMTRWAKEVSPENVLPEYPRPQMVREKWQNLNGLWDYAISPLSGKTLTEGKNTDERGIIAPDANGKPWRPAGRSHKKILVPFCPESSLSGVGKTVGPDNWLYYWRRFDLPKEWKDQKFWNDQRILLHFGAVDWHACVWVNGDLLGEHRGGYDPFTFDITRSLNPIGENEVVVAVWDPGNTGVQPCGKQHVRPHGIFYTPVTGIWQTVWIEPVPKTQIANVTVTPDLDNGSFRINATLDGPDAATMSLQARSKFEHTYGDLSASGRVAGSASPASETLELSIGSGAEILWWTPDNPYLFEIEVELVDPAGTVVDKVIVTAGLRKIEWKKADDGYNRLFLNNEPVFQYGPLDQGWWPDGLYTAPTDEALKYDIEMTKKLGFNMCRKHVKVEPARWYHWCDKLGLLVWQDMPSSDRFIGPDDPDITRTAASEEIYRREWKAIIDSLRGFPSIVVWVPFNEGWGQFKTNEILAWTKELDPTRVVDGPSGWADRNGGDMHDMHNYPGPGMFPAEEGRVSVLGEFGGLGLPLDGHTWLDKNNWGYRSFDNKDALGEAYAELLVQMPWLIGRGLSAAVYTQTTDVEIEVNGLMSYDREVVKFDVDRLNALHARLRPPAVLIPTSEDEPQTWRYTMTAPSNDSWMAPEFDDSMWPAGPGGFGTRGTPGSVVRTEWNTPEIWCRREFTLPEGNEGAELALRIHHDEDAEVYLNGKKVAELKGYTSSYTVIPLATAGASLANGRNVLAIHCHQTRGGQYIDAGLMKLTRQPQDAPSAAQEK